MSTYKNFCLHSVVSPAGTENLVLNSAVNGYLPLTVIDDGKEFPCTIFDCDEFGSPIGLVEVSKCTFNFSTMTLSRSAENVIDGSAGAGTLVDFVGENQRVAVSVLTSEIFDQLDTAIENFENKADLIDGKIPTSQIPAIAISEFLGAVADESEMILLTGQRGDYCYRNDLSAAFWLTSDDPTDADNWLQVAIPTVSVQSVNGQTGTVVLGASDVGAAASGHTHTISNVTNLQTTLDAKAPLNAPALLNTVNVTASGGTAAVNIVRTGTLSNFTMPGGCSFSVSSTSVTTAGVAAAIVSGNASQAYFYMGDTDNPTMGGLVYDNTNDTLLFRVAGVTRLTMASTVGTFTGDIQCANLRVRGGTGINTADNTTANTAKSARYSMPDYTGTGTFVYLLGSAQSGNNVAILGGGTATGYAATILRFVAAANATTTTGTTISDWTINKAGFFVPIQLPSHTVSNAPSASTSGAGSVIYCSNGDAGQPCLAVSDGTDWKRISLGSNISAT